MEKPNSTEILTLEEANALVEEHREWAEAVARGVARAWSMDWRSDGLDGAAMEALIFCARRFKPGMGIPFRGYAHRRIHEASTEQARKSKNWQRGIGSASKAENLGREISVGLLNVFPELRSGQLPLAEDGGSGDETRGAVRQLLMGASILVSKYTVTEQTPEELADYKKMVGALASFPPIHQLLVWKIYWEGYSLRGLADEWETDELNVVREHKTILVDLFKQLSPKKVKGFKIRPALKNVALRLKRKLGDGPFTEMVKGSKL